MSNQKTEELLLAGMERFTADVTPPSGLAVRAARHRRHRRIATVAAGTAATAAAILAAVVVAGPPPAAPGGQQAQTAAYVIGRTESALAAANTENLVGSDRVAASGDFQPPGPPPSLGLVTNSAVWVYGPQHKSVTYTSGGQLARVSGIAVANQQSTLTGVDYRNRTWWRQTWQSAPPQSIRNRGCQVAFSEFGGYTDLAAALRTSLSCGNYTMAGTQRVDGVEALELKPAHAARGYPYTQITFWVDPVTYLPVRSVITHDRNVHAYPSHSTGRIQIDFQWLAPTPANVAKLDVPIPPGFTEVKAP